MEYEDEGERRQDVPRYKSDVGQDRSANIIDKERRSSEREEGKGEVRRFPLNRSLGRCEAGSTRQGRERKKDALENEMSYYLTTLSSLVPVMSKESCRIRIKQWIRHVVDQKNICDRHTRNKNLLFITLNTMNDECTGFLEYPPSSLMSPMKCMTEIPKARWETDDCWQLMRRHVPPEMRFKCPAHKECREDVDMKGTVNPIAGRLMDQEFKYLLHVGRPYAALLGPEARQRAATWLAALCGVGPCSCLYMKGLRNDYVQALVGYLQDLRVPGPFSKMPGCRLAPLCEATPFTDPAGPEANQFLSEQPVPESGALCYIAVTGDTTSLHF